MNRTTLRMLSDPAATQAYRNEFTRRAERIADKPISLATNYSAAESPSEPTDNAVFYPDELADHQQAVKRDWSAFKAIAWIAGILALTCAGMGVASLIFG